MIRMLHAQTVQLWLTHAAPLLRWSTALCGLLLIAACAQLPPAPAVNSAALTQQQSLPPLAYYAWVLQAPASEIAAEQERLALPATTAPAFINAVQRSMLLGFAADTDASKVTQAIALLREVNDAQDATPAADEYEIFAGILLAHLQQKMALDRAGQHSHDLAVTVRELEAGNRELQDQIKALTSIEQQIMEREQQQTLELPLDRVDGPVDGQADEKAP